MKLYKCIINSKSTKQNYNFESKLFDHTYFPTVMPMRVYAPIYIQLYNHKDRQNLTRTNIYAFRHTYTFLCVGTYANIYD